MINPHLYVPLGKRINTPVGKHYRARLMRHGVREEIVCRPTFKTATAAGLYAQAVKARWCRLYDAAVVALAGKEPEHAA